MAAARKHHSGLMGFASKQSIAFAPRIKRLEVMCTIILLNFILNIDVALEFEVQRSFEYV